MKRRALIIYCDNTQSGPLNGPSIDETNYQAFLQSNLGGDWFSSEILSLQNPTIQQVRYAILNHLANADYTFMIFSGHGYIDTNDGGLQYCELSGGSTPLRNLWSSAKRQTIIVDACRGFYSRRHVLLEKSFSGIGDLSNFEGIPSTRDLFTRAVLNCNEGKIALYAAGRNQSALDTAGGGAYLLSLLKVAEIWENRNSNNNVLSLKNVHSGAKAYMKDNFETIQVPQIHPERQNYFPLAVKFV